MKLYRGFLIAMAVLVALGAALLIYGAAEHANRPLAPTVPGGAIRYTGFSVESNCGEEIREHV